MGSSASTPRLLSLETNALHVAFLCTTLVLAPEQKFYEHACMDEKSHTVCRLFFVKSGAALKAITLAASLASLGSACSSEPTPVNQEGAGGPGVAGRGGSADQGGRAGQAGLAAGQGGQADQQQPAGSGGAPVGMPGAGAAQGGGSGSSGAAGAPATQGGAGSGGGSGARMKVLYVAGAMPMVGIDLQIHEVLKARNMDVQDILDSAAVPTDAQAKQLIMVSFSILSTNFKAADFASVAVPLIIMEDHSLAALGMTTANGFGNQDGVTQITITSQEPTLTAGFPLGDVTVYSRVSEVFWGTPGPGAITVATVKGDSARPVTFAYPAGAMMVGRVAPAKRAQIFVAGHAPPPNPELFLSPDGLKLVDGAVAWSTH